MKITNRNNLPQPLVDAVVNDDYTKGYADYSITELLSPPRIGALKRKHWAELEEDVSDNIYRLLGKSIHEILERANRAAIAERRYFLKIEGKTVSGSLDALYDDSRSLIQDYKLMSWYEVRDGLKEEKTQQLNCYAYLVKHGYFYHKRDTQQTMAQVEPIDAKFLQIVSILRDWRKGSAGRNGMPNEQVVVTNITRWEAADTLKFLKERLALHEAARVELPLCSPEERWATPDKWAVMARKNAPKSVKNHESRADADAHAERLGKGAFVEPRPGNSNRCENYCAVSSVCSQFKNLKKEST